MDEIDTTRALLDDQISAAIAADPLAALPIINGVERDMAAHLTVAAKAAMGTASWAQIGEALGVSKQGAHQRFKGLMDSTVEAITAAHEDMKRAKRSGDREAQRAAKQRRDELVVGLKQVAKQYGRDLKS